MEIKNWNELTNNQTPEWLKKAKFGIYTHWGVYCVPACGPNVSWYPYKMYQEGSPQFEYHLKNYGHPSQVGYKDLIPMFTGEKFNAEEWADLFVSAGAKFAGPVAEHHDGFSMWNSKINEWNSVKMGPKRDVVGELEKAIRNKGMYYMTAFHHAENWKFYPHWVKEYDTSDPKYAGLYGDSHNEDWGSAKRYAPQPLERKFSDTGEVDQQWQLQDLPNQNFLDRWFGKMKEVIDTYHPDYIWFDFGLMYIQDEYQRKFLTYYRDQAFKNQQEVAISYKWNHLPIGAGLIDLEQGRFDHATYHDWITDTTVDDGEAWGYLKGATYKTPKSLIHYLVDNVSKNGYLLLNVGPKPNGEIPEQARKVLLEMGKWLQTNGEAVYDTTPWRVSEEGPTKMTGSGAFCEMDEVEYTERDIRYTMKENCIYATALGKIGDEVVLNHIFTIIYPNEINRITVLGNEQDLSWTQKGKKLIINTADIEKNEIANVIKIQRKNIFMTEE